MRIKLQLWYKAETDQALLVESLDHTLKVWLPRAWIKVGDRKLVPNPLFGTQPHIAQFEGSQVTVDMPLTLAKEKGLI